MSLFNQPPHFLQVFNFSALMLWITSNLSLHFKHLYQYVGILKSHFQIVVKSLQKRTVKTIWTRWIIWSWTRLKALQLALALSTTAWTSAFYKNATTQNLKRVGWTTMSGIMIENAQLIECITKATKQSCLQMEVLRPLTRSSHQDFCFILANMPCKTQSSKMWHQMQQMNRNTVLISSPSSFTHNYHTSLVECSH